jgi:hypothetical protein
LRLRGFEGARRHDHDPPAPALKFDGVAGEFTDLRMAEVDHRPPRFSQPLGNLGVPRRIADRVEPDQAEIGADAHQHIGVINRPALGVDRIEDHRLEVEMRAETLQHDLIGAIGAGGIGDVLESQSHPGGAPCAGSARTADRARHDHPNGWRASCWGRWNPASRGPSSSKRCTATPAASSAAAARVTSPWAATAIVAALRPTSMEQIVLGRRRIRAEMMRTDHHDAARRRD